MQTYSYKKIRNNIWQIEEDNGVYCTLVQGSVYQGDCGKSEIVFSVDKAEE